MSSLTIDDILRGTTRGRVQSVGVMQVVPILGDDSDEFAPPEVEVRTSTYGTVHLRNEADLPTIVPTNAGWIVQQAAQDHAIASAALIKAKSERTINTAMCIQSSQGGIINKAKHDMLILPAALRAPSLARRKENDFRKLWESIGTFNQQAGSNMQGAHLHYFLDTFGKQLDEFVAEFEIVKDQVGAIILIDGTVIGIERVPSHAYWQTVWTPLVRICYGSLALQAGRSARTLSTRRPLVVGESTLEGLLAALESAELEEQQAAEQALAAAASALNLAAADDSLDGYKLHTVASEKLAGQVLRSDKALPYASLCATNA